MKKQAQKIVPAVLLIALVASLFWVRQESKAKAMVTDLLEGQYQSAFYDLVGGMEELSILTGKVQYTSSTPKEIQYLTQISQQSAVALKNLANLPLEHNSITRSGKFLNQLADYAGVMAQKRISGQDLSETEKENLKALGEQVAEISTDLLALQKQLNDENILFYSNVEPGSDEDIIGNQFAAIDTRAKDYPTLDYEGGMADRVEEIEVLGLTEDSVTVEEAIAKAKQLTGLLGTDGEYTFAEAADGSFSENALIPLYRLTASQEEEEILLDISKQGGRPVMVINTRPIGGVTLEVEEAQQKAEEFLEVAGFGDMVLTNTYDEGNSITFTYNANDNQISAAADAVQVRVALDNGQIIAMNASNYFTSHHTRENTPPTLTAAEAKEGITKLTPVGEGSLTFIKTAFGTEVLCYQFDTEEGYRVFINANTGQEEDLQQIIQGEGGPYAR